MVLEPTSILRIRDSERFARISYVFEDDDGLRTGVTSRWLSQAPKPSVFEQSRMMNRPDVLLNDTKVGLLNPIYNPEYPSSSIEDISEPSILAAGTLTCSFLLNPGIQISNQFRSVSEGRIVPMEAITDDDVHILGDGPVGTIRGDLEYLRVGVETIYPLLRLHRSQEDFSRLDVGIRNGAMVITSNSALIGMIIGLSNDGRVYSVAPIADVLAWHKLQFLTLREEIMDRITETIVRTSPYDALPEGLDECVRELVDS